MLGTGVAIGFLGAASRGRAAIGKIEKPRLEFGLTLDAASFASVYVAQARTWKAQGLDIESVTFRGEAESSQALTGDSVDISLQSPFGVISMANAGVPAIGFFAGFFQADFEWMTQPSIKTWSDMKGKTAGVSTIGSLTDNLTRYLLVKNGLQPEKDVQIVQIGPTANALQGLKTGRLGMAMLSPPFKWTARAAGFNTIATQARDIGRQWPKHIFIAKKKFLDENPNTVKAFLRGYVAAIRLARADKAMTVALLAQRLKYSPADAARAYDEIMPGYDEHGVFPGREAMDLFWNLEVKAGDVKAPWPQERVLDDRFIKSFADWAP
jgi:ABC-type nitrate/sulfonate/bicarbonate transport system substrate-binding protein